MKDELKTAVRSALLGQRASLHSGSLCQCGEDSQVLKTGVRPSRTTIQQMSNRDWGPPLATSWQRPGEQENQQCLPVYANLIAGV